MAPAGYAPLPNPRSQPDVDDRELNEAFESDGEEYDEQHHTESTPFIRSQSPHEQQAFLSVAIPGAYDFERDYDHPPPGSPPGPSTVAFPNDYGNSNGQLGSTPVRPPTNRPSFFRRAAGALLPQYYARVPTEPTPSQAIGGGTDNDGVFANVMAKPGRAVQVQNENGDVHLVPEDTQKDMPPSYHEAQQDAVPQYWETTVHAPMNTDPNADMIVDDLPTGSLVLFVSNAFISFFFGFVGFLLTYLLHTSHAAKYGSRAGLGMTLIQYGFVSRNKQFSEEPPEEMRRIYVNATTGMIEMGPLPPQPVHDLGQNETFADGAADIDGSSHDWISLVLMTMGWFLLLLSIVGYYRVKRWETSIRASTRSTTTTATTTLAATEESSPRPNSESIYLFSADEIEADENALRRGGEAEVLSEAEARFARDLMRAGLL